MTAGEELRELREAVTAAEARVAELDRQRRQAPRAVEAAKGDYRDYWRGIEAGERERDEAVERELRAAVSDCESVVTAKPLLAGGRLWDFELVDERTEAQLEAARDALEQHRAAVESFVAERRPELVAERLDHARALGAQLADAASALAHALNEHARERRELAVLGVANDLPEHPFEANGLQVGQALANVDRARREDPAALVPSPRWASEAER